MYDRSLPNQLNTPTGEGQNIDTAGKVYAGTFNA